MDKALVSLAQLHIQWQRRYISVFYNAGTLWGGGRREVKDAYLQSVHWSWIGNGTALKKGLVTI